jgi:hypothetical protein
MPRGKDFEATPSPVAADKATPAPAELKRSRTRAFADSVFGVGGGIAGTVYGTIVVMATVTVAYTSEKRLWKLVAIVVGTALVLWIAHFYAHGLSESIEKRRRLARQEGIAIARRELGILLAAAGPTVALLLGAIGLLRSSSAVWLALGVGLATLAVEGVRYARIEGFGRPGTAVAVAINLALGLLVVAFKVALAH